MTNKYVINNANNYNKYIITNCPALLVSGICNGDSENDCIDNIKQWLLSEED